MKKIFIGFLAILMASCVSTRPPHPGGVKSQYVDPGRNNTSSGVGIEPNDIKAISDKMMRSILQNAPLEASGTVPRIIVDNERFVNESNHILNINTIVDQLRINLLKAAGGKIIFLSRENIDLVEEEKDLKAQGIVDDGDNRDKRIKGADYRLTGRITSESRVSPSSGVKSNYYQFSFELLDLEDGAIVWADNFDFQKQGADDTVYR